MKRNIIVFILLLIAVLLINYIYMPYIHDNNIYDYHIGVFLQRLFIVPLAYSILYIIPNYKKKQYSKSHKYTTLLGIVIATSLLEFFGVLAGSLSDIAYVGGTLLGGATMFFIIRKS